MFRSLAALSLATVLMAGTSGDTAAPACSSVPVMATHGICSQAFGVGTHVVVVAVPCAANLDCRH